MLALFKDTPETLQLRPDPIEWGQMEWRKSLDKGHVPTPASLLQRWVQAYPAGTSEEHATLTEWANQLAKAPWLTNFLQKPKVREIFCHGPQLIEAVGEDREIAICPLTQEDWSLWVETLACQIHLECNFSRPCASGHTHLEGHEWRVTLLHESSAPKSLSKVFFRRLASIPYSLQEYDIPREARSLLKALIHEQENLLIAGATGSGKTSFMSTLLSEINEQEHLVVLEDTQELSLQHARMTRLLAGPQVGRNLCDYLAHALRLSPDRIVLGEMRSHEVVPYLLAMNTGHKGLMSTLHASSASDALLRVAQLFILASGHREMDYREVLRLVTKNVGVVAFLEKRRVTQIIRVFGCDGDQPLYDVLWSPE